VLKLHTHTSTLTAETNGGGHCGDIGYTPNFSARTSSGKLLENDRTNSGVAITAGDRNFAAKRGAGFALRPAGFLVYFLIQVMNKDLISVSALAELTCRCTTTFAHKRLLPHNGKTAEKLGPVSHARSMNHLWQNALVRR